LVGNGLLASNKLVMRLAPVFHTIEGAFTLYRMMARIKENRIYYLRNIANENRVCAPLYGTYKTCLWYRL